MTPVSPRAPRDSGARTLPRLIGECFRFPGRLAVICASLLALGGARLYVTWLVKLGEAPLQAGDMQTIVGLMTTGAAAAGVMIVAMFVSRYALASVNQALVQQLRDAVQRRVLNMQIVALREFQSGELVSRVFNDAGALSSFVQDILKRLMGETMVLIGAIAMMFYLQWWLALFTCAIVPPAALLLSRLGRAIRRRGVLAQQEIGTLTATFNEQLRGLTTIKGFQTEGFEHQRFVRQDASYRRQMMRGERWGAILVTTVSFVAAGGLFGILWYGTRQVMAGRTTPGELLVFSLYAVQTIVPLRRLSDVHGLLQRAIAAAQRVYEVIDAEPVDSDDGRSRGTAGGDSIRLGLSPVARRRKADAAGADAQEAPTLRAGGGDASTAVAGAVRFEHLSFRYRPDTPVLDQLDLHVAPRETVALVAASGGGKSTLASLLVRFIEPNDGRILLDGSDLRALPVEVVRRRICVVEQEPFVFSGPLIDNLRYGCWQAPPAAIEAAVVLAGLERLVQTLPGGLRARLDEVGRDLSGGQKQRIALGRAIVRDPAVLVLYEATSALDSDTERQVFTQLAEWLGRRTVLIMAHRLSTISRFDRVVVLEGGRLVGDGSVPALLRSCPPFGRLFAEQVAPLGALRDHADAVEAPQTAPDAAAAPANRTAARRRA